MQVVQYRVSSNQVIWQKNFKKGYSVPLEQTFTKKLNKVSFKMYDVTTWLANNCNTHIDQYLLLVIRQWNFGQLIEHNIRNILLKKSYAKCDRDTTPRSFSKKSKLSMSLDQKSRVSYSLFLLHAKLRDIRICWN